MASVINDIINAALVKVGATTISNLTDGTPNANFMNTRYEQVRDSALQRHPWNFSTKGVQLARLASTPAVKFQFEYQLPNDFLRAVTVHDNDAGAGILDFKILGRKIQSNSDQCWLIYIFRVTDPNEMQPLFREYLSSLLAKEAAMGIVNSNTLYEVMREESERAERRARGADSQSDLPPRLPKGSWLRVRFRGHGTDGVGF